MNKSLAFAAASLAVTATAAAAPNDNAGNARRPNIILFLVDDMGWQDTSLPFWTERTQYNNVYETPNMERLARQGMMFTQAYAASVSSPSRCSLITGANNARHRVTNWTLERDKSVDLPSDVVDCPDWNINGVSQVAGTPHTYVGTSFVELLRHSGYHTIHCGKAHFGAMDTPGENPTHWGFEVNIAGHAAGGLATYLSELNYGHTKDGKPTSLMSIPGLEKYWGTGTFVTEALTKEAIGALDKAKKYNQPFFLYMSHYAIHIPIDRDERFFSKYVRKGLSDKEAAYASLIEGMDKSLGDLMDWVERNGEKDNTIILFMSDNGGLATNPTWRDGELFHQNYPLLSGKCSLYEGGIREPMIVSWPGVTRAGSKCDKYTMIEDFYPHHSRNGWRKQVQDRGTYRRNLVRSDAARDGRHIKGPCTGVELPQRMGQQRTRHQPQLRHTQGRVEADILLRHGPQRTLQHPCRHQRAAQCGCRTQGHREASVARTGRLSA